MNEDSRSPESAKSAVSASAKDLAELERLSAKGKRDPKPLVLNELPRGRRRDFRGLFFLGNGLFVAAVFFCQRYLGGVGILPVVAFWLFYNVMIAYIMYGIMSRY